MTERQHRTLGREAAEEDGTGGPRLSVASDRAKLGAATVASAARFVQWMREREGSLARGFDRLLALEDLDLTLFPHQRSAVLRVLRDMRGRALLADEVGLGKTIEAGVIAKEYIVRGLARKLLVLAPATLIGQWKQELRDKLDLPCPLYASGLDWRGEDRLIASLDTARRPEHAAALQEVPWDIVIVDEAHRLKNRRTRGWRLVDGLQKKYLLLLTATPIQNDLEELYNMVTLLQPGLLKTYREFQREHVADRLRAKQAQKLRDRIGQAIVRTTRAAVALSLPRRVVRTVPVPLPEEEREFYDDVLAFARSAFARTGRGKGAALTLVLLLREVCSSPEAAEGTLRALARSERLDGPGQRRASQLAEAARRLAGRWSKLNALTRWLKEAAESAVVFTQFRGTQAALAAKLQETGMPTHLFHGAMTRETRQDALERFRREGGVLVSTEAGSEGQNLQFCRLVVNCDLPWNPMRLEQRIGRVHRLGQTRDVIVVNAVTPDTMEMHVFRLLHDKIKLFEQVIGELDVILARPDPEGATPGRAFETEIGLAFLGAADEEDAARRVDAIGRDVSERVAELEAVRRLNARLLPETFVSEGEASVSPGAGTAASGVPVARRSGRSGGGAESGALFATFTHPLSLDPWFASDVLGRARHPHPLLQGLREREGRLQFVGGRARELERRIVHQPLWLFCFQAAYRSDETWESMHFVGVDPLTENASSASLPEEYVDDFPARIVQRAEVAREVGAGFGPERDYAARRTFGAALEFVRDHIERAEGLERLKEAEVRLARDVERLERFYEGLEEEALLPVVQQLRRLERSRTRERWARHVLADGNPEPTAGEAEERVWRRAEEIAAALQEERRRRVTELAGKYSVRVDLQLLGWAKMLVPRVELVYKLMAPVRRDFVFYYDPLAGSLLDVDCEGCGAALDTVRVSASGDLLCGPCAAPGRASGV